MNNHKKTILFIPGFVCDTWCIIEQYSISLTKELCKKYNIIWLAPNIKNPYNHFKNKNNRKSLKEPVYVTEAKKQNIKVVTADLSKFNFIKNLFILNKLFKKYNIDATYMQFGFERYIGMICTKLLRKKVIYGEHGYPPKLKYPLIRNFLYTLFVDDFITVSNASANKLPKNKPIHVIHNAINIFNESIIDEQKRNKNYYKEKLGLNNFDFIIIMVAAFRQMKRHDLALKIAEKVINKSNKRIGFVFLGDGELYGEYQKEFKQKNLSNKIICPGHVNNINEYLAASDISILTSDWESFGLCLIESMQYKLATITFDRISVREIIENKKDGILIAPEDINGFINEILFLTETPQEIKKIGKNAYEKVKNNFNMNTWKDNMNEIFEKIENEQ